jgi:hypothetical protein
VVVRPEALWLGAFRPAHPTFGLDGERAELVKGKGAVTLVLEQVLDACQLLLAERVG